MTESADAAAKGATVVVQDYHVALAVRPLQRKAEGLAAVRYRILSDGDAAQLTVAKGARDVFVSARDLDRAHEVLKADEGSFSDEELGRVSEEAGQEPDGR